MCNRGICVGGGRYWTSLGPVSVFVNPDTRVPQSQMYQSLIPQPPSGNGPCPNLIAVSTFCSRVRVRESQYSARACLLYHPSFHPDFWDPCIRAIALQILFLVYGLLLKPCLVPGNMYSLRQLVQRFYLNSTTLSGGRTLISSYLIPILASHCTRP